MSRNAQSHVILASAVRSIQREDQVWKCHPGKIHGDLAERPPTAPQPPEVSSRLADKEDCAVLSYVVDRLISGIFPRCARSSAHEKTEHRANTSRFAVRSSSQSQYAHRGRVRCLVCANL